MQVRMPMRGPQFVLAIGILAASGWPARAAEQITLTNGFEISCHHHASVERRVRLYMGIGSDSYIEVAPGEIASVERVPDPPPPPAETVASAPAAGSPPDANPGKADLTQADLHEMLAKAGHEHNVDVDLLASVVKAESGGNAHAISRAGAQGLMQLMPDTAADLGVADSFRPEQNVRGGSTYLDELLTRYHDNLSLALAAYNAGPAAVDKYHGIPPYRETRLYVARVIHEFNRRVRAREAQEKRAVASASAHGN
ncbi:MAG TPA: lytic transglycosylase domain-containing protein [Terracidiphilus sp.]|nr:lytic transglycosylase domain-containing protein [Terracidiphilus sp.]